MIFNLALAILVILQVIFLVRWGISIFVRRRVNYLFSTLVAEGYLEKARAYFERTLDVAPPILAFNPTLIEAALDINSLASAQSSTNLRRFFNDLADLYLRRQPYSGFANIFAAGIKRRREPKLSALYIRRALAAQPDWEMGRLASILSQEIDVCSAVALGVRTLSSLPANKLYRRQRLESILSLTNALQEAGAHYHALYYCRQSLRDPLYQPLDAWGQSSLLTRQLDILADVGQSPLGIEALMGSSLPPLYLVSFLPWAIIESAAYRRANETIEYLQTLRQFRELRLPAWMKEGLPAYSRLMRHLSALTPQRAANIKEDEQLESLVQVLRGMCDVCHDCRPLHAMAADAFFCAGRYRLAQLYLERSQKLPYGLQIFKDQQEEEEQSTPEWVEFTLYWGMAIQEPRLGAGSELWHFHSQQGDWGSAELWLKRRFKDEDLPLLERAQAHLGAVKLYRELKKNKEAQQQLHKARQLLTEYRQNNHLLESTLLPPRQVLESILNSPPRCNGNWDFHYAWAQLLWLEGEKLEELQELLRSLLPLYPRQRSLLRLTAEVALGLEDRDLAAVIIPYLQANALSVREWLLLGQLQELIPPPTLQESVAPVAEETQLWDLEAEA